MSPSRQTGSGWSLAMTLQDLVGHLAIAQEIRKPPETNGASEGFSLLYELVWFSLFAQATKFAALSDARHSGMSVAKFYHRAAEFRRDEKEGGEPWYLVLFYGF